MRMMSNPVALERWEISEEVGLVLALKMLWGALEGILQLVPWQEICWSVHYSWDVRCSNMYVEDCCEEPEAPKQVHDHVLHGWALCDCITRLRLSHLNSILYFEISLLQTAQLNTIGTSSLAIMLTSGIASSKPLVGYTLREGMGFWWWIAKIVHVYWMVIDIKS